MLATIESLSSPLLPADLAALETLLIACVHGGASIGFLTSLAPDEARAYWAGVVADHAAGKKIVLVARVVAGGPIVGSAQLALETRPNGRHRAEVQKVMVLPSHRRLGLAVRLMAEIEQRALLNGVRLLFLDTSEGDSGAGTFYEALGYHYAGGIPGYALDPDGQPAKNAIYYKTLNGEG